MKKIFLAGHEGMVGSAIFRILSQDGEIEILTRRKSELDLRDQTAVQRFFAKEKPNEVILAAARVGGIVANQKYPSKFIFENLQIQNSVIYASHVNNVEKLLFLGSSCIYPKLAKQPIDEAEILSGYLEPTNEPYAIAKIAGMKLCQSLNFEHKRDYRTVMPTNLYGPGDNYHPNNSHVIPGLIHRFHNSKINNEKEVIVWGSGEVKREFLFVDDMAEAALFVHSLDKESYADVTGPNISHLNIGTGGDLTIRDLAEIIRKVVGYEGNITFDESKPEGTPRKLLNVNRINKLGWFYKTELEEGLKRTYNEYLKLVM